MNALWTRMRALADQGHARAGDLRRQADEVETNAMGFYADPQTVSTPVFLGSWARARKLWCECSGEPLV